MQLSRPARISIFLGLYLCVLPPGFAQSRLTTELERKAQAVTISGLGQCHANKGTLSPRKSVEVSHKLLKEQGIFDLVPWLESLPGRTAIDYYLTHIDQSSCKWLETNDLEKYLKGLAQILGIEGTSQSDAMRDKYAASFHDETKILLTQAGQAMSAEDYPEAIASLERLEKHLDGYSDPTDLLSFVLGQLSWAYFQTDRLDKALKYVNSQIDRLENKSDREPNDLVDSLSLKGMILSAELDKGLISEEAWIRSISPVRVKRLEIIEKFYQGQEQKLALADEWILSGDLAARREEHDTAKSFYLKVLALTKDDTDADPDSQIAFLRETALSRVAYPYSERGDYRNAGLYYEEAIRIAENASSRERQLSAAFYRNAYALSFSSQIGQIEPKNLNKVSDLRRRSYLGYKQLKGESDIETIRAANAYGSVLEAQGKTTKAIEIYSRSKLLLEQSGSASSDDYIDALAVLASAHNVLGNNSETVYLMETAVRLALNLFGPDHEKTRRLNAQLGLGYFQLGQVDKAKKILVREKDFFSEGSPYSRLLKTTLAMISGQPTKSIESGGKQDHLTIMADFTTATSYMKNGKYNQAYALYRQLLDVAPGILGENKFLGTLYLGLAQSSIMLGNIPEALDYSFKGVQYLDDFLGKDTPDLSRAELLLIQAFADYRLGDSSESEKTNRKFLAELNSYVYKQALGISSGARYRLIELTNSLHNKGIALDVISQSSSRNTLQAVLNRKGLLEDLERKQKSLLKLSPDQKIYLSQLQEITDKLSTAGLADKERSLMLAQRRKIEIELYRLLPDLKRSTPSVDEIARLLPANSLFVHYYRYSPIPLDDPSAKQEDRYIALILDNKSDVKLFDLGLSDTTDKIISSTIESIRNRESHVEAQLTKLQDRLIKPIQSRFAGKRQVFFALDSEIHRVPIALLLNSYKNNPTDSQPIGILVSSGSDFRALFSTQSDSQLKQEASLVISNPDFNIKPVLAGSRLTNTAQDRSAQSSKQLGDIYWSQLPATKKEGNFISALLKADHLSGTQATVTNIKRVNSPYILHIASHAYYLPESTVQEGSTDSYSLLASSSNSNTDSSLLRSGVVLAGANASITASEEDPYLTALEFASLNLEQTELVTISACQTGEGDIKTGSGIYGLQRSILIAGAKSSLLTLWPVDDAATSRFMQSFYSKLSDGESRIDALRRTQSEFQSHPIPAWRHPYFWAAFELTGDWRPLSIK